MKKILNPTIFILVLALFLQTASGQNSKKSNATGTFRIAFYNVENLFDTIDDPHTNDNDFLPGAKIPWTPDRYETKLNHLAEVIKGLSDQGPVAIMGLAEVENSAVLDDLVNSPAIIPYHLQVIHRESPDERGIDNALIYDGMRFEPIKVTSIPVKLDPEDNDKTRDILYVKGINPGAKSDTLHIFVNHWPSRSGGQAESEPKRVITAETLKRVTDSVINNNPKALVVIMGDLNDEPSDKSLAALKAGAPVDSPEPATLYNLMYPLFKQGKGTLYYNDWDMFDQVIVNGYLLSKQKGLVLSQKEGNIYSPQWLLFTNDKGVSRPNRTAGNSYYGGYSDHLPVYVDLQVKK
jgi:predicted extracellular nuclease